MDIEHGASHDVSVFIRNDNSICSIHCYYYKDGNEDQQYEIGTLSKGQSLSKTLFSVFAPLTETNEISREVKVVCEEEYIFLLCTSDPRIIPETKTFQVILTQEEKEAKQFIETNVFPLSDDLTQTDTDFGRFESKINNLEKSVKIGSLMEDFQGNIPILNQLKNDIENIESLFENEDYIQAKSNYKSSFSTDLTNLNTKLNEFENRLKTILEEHAKVVVAFNTLSNKINSLLSYSKILNKKAEVDLLFDKVKSLESKFNSGNFNTYGDILSDIKRLDSEISIKISSFEQEIETIVQQGIALISDEFERVCEIKDYCNFNKNIELIDDNFKNLNSVCSKINPTLNSVFQKANDKDWKDYRKEITEIEQQKNKIEEENKRIEKQNEGINTLNKKLKQQNKKIEELNLLVNDINYLLKKNRIEDIDITDCSDKLNDLGKISASETSEKLNDAKNICNPLKEQINEEVKIKEQNFFFRLKRLFFFLTPYKRQSLPTIHEIPIKSLLDKKKIPSRDIEEPIDIEFSTEIKEFSLNYCGIDLSKIERVVSDVDNPNVEEDPNIESDLDFTFTEKEGQCCLGNTCESCCDDATCKSDPSNYPIVFVHGHSGAYGSDVRNSIDAFTKIQDKLRGDGFLAQGVLLPDPKYKRTFGEMGRLNVPITFRTTYYVGSYNEEGDNIGDEKSENIEDYAQHLSDAIDIILHNTGRPKVNIIAHSMGGLVARQYIKNPGGSSKVDKLIMIGTPNHGIWKRDGIPFFCGFFVPRAECDDMHHESDFIIKLNSGGEANSPVKYMTIASNSFITPISGDQYDGVIRISSTELEWATNHVIPRGSEIGNTHSKMLDPNKFPQVYDYLVDFLK